MKRFAAVVAGVTAMLGAGVATGQQTTPNYVNGAIYLAMTSGEREIYDEGLWDMLERMAEAVDDPQEKAFLTRVSRCTSGMRSGDLRAFVDSYVASNAAFRDYGMASNFRAAMNARCPS